MGLRSTVRQTKARATATALAAIWLAQTAAAMAVESPPEVHSLRIEPA